ncbi:hypothetical protein D9758_015444 [Tetrapyrgos nigripes]|uniref:Uncharacterized protein n=1 Tax=Tetrapyrgos nigripes TaxID=182062 RepID=A0A8H5CMM6_9AGAR|nr:hypothetical protein D9758_015444 [Tetrapyrgos nigripes]
MRPGYEYDGVDEIRNEEAEEARDDADAYYANATNTPTMRTTPTHLLLRLFTDMHDQDSEPHPPVYPHFFQAILRVVGEYQVVMPGVLWEVLGQSLG